MSVKSEAVKFFAEASELLGKLAKELQESEVPESYKEETNTTLSKEAAKHLRQFAEQLENGELLVHSVGRQQVHFSDQHGKHVDINLVVKAQEAAAEAKQQPQKRMSAHAIKKEAWALFHLGAISETKREHLITYADSLLKDN